MEGAHFGVGNDPDGTLCDRDRLLTSLASAFRVDRAPALVNPSSRR